MPKHVKPINPADIVKIKCLVLPEFKEIGEGDYEVRFGAIPNEPELHDIMSLEKKLQEIMPDRVVDIIDRLQNFMMAYLNLDTGEITS